nr:YopX family protein [Aneurinibacillus sp. XH2]
MREHKYRGWHKESNTMLYDEKPGDVLRWKAEGQEIEVMQYTGIKDKNGVEIYEGDILQGYNGIVSSEEERYVIHFLESDCRYIAIYADGYAEGGRDDLHEAQELVWVNCAVNGNTYENPELLEVKA